MVYKRTVVEERLKHLLETLSRLKDLSKISKKEFLEDYGIQWQVERGLQLVAESFFDIGDHILTAHFNCSPASYEEVTSKLAEKKVLSKGLAKKLAGFGGFRNVIVHDYLSIDKNIVYDRLTNGLNDLDTFVKEMLRFINTSNH